MKKLILLLFLFAGIRMFGQNIYEIKYTFNKVDKDGNETNVVDREYDALLFYYNTQDTNIMRVRYLDDRTNTFLIVEQKVTTQMTESNGKQYWALVGDKPHFVSTVSDDYHYYADKIVLAKNPDDKYYSPVYVSSKDAPQNSTIPDHVGKVISFTLLVKENISNDYMGLYGWRWPDKEQVKTDINKDNTAATTGTTMYLIQVTNSLDDSLGVGFYENHLKINYLFSNAAKMSGINFQNIEIFGTNFNKANVLKAINDVHPGPNDILIFYYSGHGYRYIDQQSEWPRMVLLYTLPPTIEYLHENSLSLDDDVYKPLATKGARLLMVIGECCNDTVPGAPYTPSFTDPIHMSASAGNFSDPDLIKSLLQESGKMLLATSKPSESTWYFKKDGGFFGNSFIDNITKETSFTNAGNPVSWRDIISNAMKETTSKSIADEPSTKEQNPIIYFEIK